MAAPNMNGCLHLTDVHQNSPASFISPNCFLRYLIFCFPFRFPISSLSHFIFPFLVFPFHNLFYMGGGVVLKSIYICFVIFYTGADTGGGVYLVAPPRSLERKNPMGTNIGKSPISDNL